jgi:hypothetical protein
MAGFAGASRGLRILDQSFVPNAEVTVCGLFASTAARAEEVHYAGGPIQAGNQCWVSTNNDNGFGFWRDCPKPEHVSKKKIK